MSPEVVDEAIRAVAAVGLRLAGVDIITPDLGKGIADAGGAIVEVNSPPGLHYHYLTAERRQRQSCRGPCPAAATRDLIRYRSPGASASRLHQLREQARGQKRNDPKTSTTPAEISIANATAGGAPPTAYLMAATPAAMTRVEATSPG